MACKLQDFNRSASVFGSGGGHHRFVRVEAAHLLALKGPREGVGQSRLGEVDETSRSIWDRWKKGPKIMGFGFDFKTNQKSQKKRGGKNFQNSTDITRRVFAQHITSHPVRDKIILSKTVPFLRREQ